MKWIALAWALSASAICAQVSNPAAGVREVATNAANDAVVASSPPDCPAPLSDGSVATAGTQTRCLPRSDAQRAAIIQSRSLTTASDGTFSGSWDAQFPRDPTATWAIVPYSDGDTTPYVCSVRGVSTGFVGKCWQVVGTTLPSTINAVLGLVTSPVRTPTASVIVKVGARL